MPLTLRTLRDSTRKLEIHWTTVEETTTLSYRAMRHYDAFEELRRAYRANADGDPDLNARANAAYLCAVVAEWDLQDEPAAKRPVPLKPEALLPPFPTSVVLAIMDAIAEDMNVHPLRALPSQSGLSLVASAGD